MSDSHWRHTANETKFWIIDAKAFSPFPILLIVKSLTILIIGCVFVLFFIIIERKGFNFSNFLRKLRTYVTGHVKKVRAV